MLANHLACLINSDENGYETQEYTDIRSSPTFKNAYSIGKQRMLDIQKWGYFDIPCWRKNRTLPVYEATFIIAQMINFC